MDKMITMQVDLKIIIKQGSKVLDTIDRANLTATEATRRIQSELSSVQDANADIRMEIKKEIENYK
jgi:hypothetical protein